MGLASRIAAAAFVVLASAAPSAAQGEAVHADSFGNLVIYSPSGYKRIVVGAGHLAPRFEDQGSYYDTDEPEVLTRDGRYRRYGSTCSRAPVVLQGRSYMYGLPRDAVVVPVRHCE